MDQIANIIGSNEIKVLFTNPKELKDYLLLTLITQKIREERITTLIRFTASQEIRTNPEFLTAKLINYIPERIIEYVIK